MYYEGKIKSLMEIFGVEDVVLEPDSLTVGRQRYPIVDDVILLSDPGQYTSFVKAALGAHRAGRTGGATDFAEDVQHSFGEEWKNYGEILPEHRQEFTQYFDLVDLRKFRPARLCDLGCGNGRWSYFLKDLCQEIILVDFSDAIFVARKNLVGAQNCLFFMADLRTLPFKHDFCDFLFCLGVLHHLPSSCLEALRALSKFAPRLLIFLYYAFDNRPAYFRMLLAPVTLARGFLCKVRHPFFRKVFSRLVALFVYKPFIYLGRLLPPRLSRYVPLFEFYRDKSLRRIEQDVYDRFFTRIEQRVTRREILELRDTFARIVISENLPYWHFLCLR